MEVSTVNNINSNIKTVETIKVKGFVNPKEPNCTCLTCGKRFWIRPAIIDKGYGKFCSTKCYYDYGSMRFHPKICPTCKQTYQPNSSVQTFCSVICQELDESIRKPQQNKDYYNKNKDKILKKNKKYRERNLAKISENNSKYHKSRVKEFKAEIFTLLGFQCTNPYKIDHSAFIEDKDYYKVLQIDHVHGSGTEERRRFKHTAYDVYLQFILGKIKAGSDDYQLLCPTCNWLKRIKNKENGVDD